MLIVLQASVFLPLPLSRKYFRRKDQYVNVGLRGLQGSIPIRRGVGATVGARFVNVPKVASPLTCFAERSRHAFRPLQLFFCRVDDDLAVRPMDLDDDHFRLLCLANHGVVAYFLTPMVTVRVGSRDFGFLPVTKAKCGECSLRACSFPCTYALPRQYIIPGAFPLSFTPRTTSIHALAPSKT